MGIPNSGRGVGSNAGLQERNRQLLTYPIYLALTYRAYLFLTSGLDGFATFGQGDADLLGVICPRRTGQRTYHEAVYTNSSIDEYLHSKNNRNITKIQYLDLHPTPSSRIRFKICGEVDHLRIVHDALAPPAN